VPEGHTITLPDIGPLDPIKKGRLPIIFKATEDEDILNAEQAKVFAKKYILNNMDMQWTGEWRPRD
jgi:hypothetical protein